jgi:17beta-estradiol 17-dehydrogenase / very-long-chain 3-oxoacyl-CoA reductase
MDFDLDFGLPPWVLKSAGIAFFIILFLKIVHFLFFMVLEGRKKLKDAKNGRWAIVTGASDGIGKEFCFALAKKGYNICLLSRTKSKLDAVAEVCRASKVETKVVPIDFSLEPREYTNILQAEVAGLEADVLVNNVGISFQYPEFYLQTEDNLDERMINVNIQSMLKMTRAVLPGMVERKHGFVINLSSIAGTTPIPLLSTYSASKVFVDYFSQAIQEEYKKDGIVVKCATPMFVATEMAKMRPSFTVPTPKRVAEDCLSHLGGDVTFSPYWVHRFMQSAISVMPDGMRSSYLFSTNLKIKKSALRKLERAKQQGK